MIIEITTTFSFHSSSLAQHDFVPDLILTSTLTRSLETSALMFPNQFVPFHCSQPTANVQTTELLNDQVVSWADAPSSDEREVLRDRPQLARFSGAHSSSRYHHVCCDYAKPLRRQWKYATKPQDGHTADFEHFKSLEAQYPDQFTFPEETRESAQLRAALVWRLLAEVPEPNVAVFTHSKLIKHGYHIHLLGPLICETAVGEFDSGKCRDWESIAMADIEYDPVDELLFYDLVEDLKQQELEKEVYDSKNGFVARDGTLIEESKEFLKPLHDQHKDSRSTPIATPAASSPPSITSLNALAQKKCIQCNGVGKIQNKLCPMCSGAGIASATSIAHILGSP